MRLARAALDAEAAARPAGARVPRELRALEHAHRRLEDRLDSLERTGEPTPRAAPVKSRKERKKDGKRGKKGKKAKK